MVIQIRKGVFETNSSSTHSITICSKDDWESFKNGAFLFHQYNEELVPTPVDFDDDTEELLTHKQWESGSMETHLHEFTTQSGDEIVVFSSFGYDG